MRDVQLHLLPPIFLPFFPLRPPARRCSKAAGAGRVLNAVATAILWLAGAAGGWAAESAAGTHAGGGEAPFLNAWLLLGPCPGGEDLGLETAFIDEANAMPRAGLTMAGKPWEAWDDRLYCRNYDDYQDLYGYYRIVKKQPVANCAAHAHLYVWPGSAV